MSSESSRFIADVDTETKKRLNCVGRTQVIIGLLSCVSHSASLSTLSRVSYLSNYQIGIGFLNAALFVVTGLLGIASGNSKKHSTVIAFSALSIASTMACCSLFGVSYFWCELIYTGYYEDMHWLTALVMQLKIICLVVLEAIVSVWSATVCCAIATNRSPISEQAAHKFQGADILFQLDDTLVT